MTQNDDSVSKIFERIPSGVPGLDVITRGGLFRGGVYMILAPPGSGKTILGNEICFHHVAAGGRAVYVTLLTESHARLIASLQGLRFFDTKHVGSSLTYITGHQALEKEGLKGLLLLLRQIVRDHKATLLVIDGFLTAGAMAESELETKKFVQELQVFVELVGCTTLMLTGAHDTDEPYALRTMVDGLLELKLNPFGMEAARTIEVPKLRGSESLLGQHLFRISDDGVTIFPRTESRYGGSLERVDPTLTPPAAFGVKGLDAMLDGGLRAGSASMVLGAPGTGKTHLGLSFLSTGAKKGEPGLYFGFFETEMELRRKAEATGIDFAAGIEGGRVKVLCPSPLGAIADEHAEVIFADVKARGVRRLFIDGLGGFRDSLVYENRSRRFFHALCNELRALGVVTVLSDETRNFDDIELPAHGLAGMLDNVISLRHVEVAARIEKLLAVTKMRGIAGDSSVRGFYIDSGGFQVAMDSKSALATLSGGRSKAAARKTPPPAKKSVSAQSKRSKRDKGKGRGGRNAR